MQLGSLVGLVECWADGMTVGAVLGLLDGPKLGSTEGEVECNNVGNSLGTELG